jgi:uncharacterized protein YcbK (DUF882 family)
VLLQRARELPLALAFARSGARLGMAGLLVLIAGNALQSAIAEGDTRTLSFHHVHTGENITVTFKRDGHYVPSALKKLDWFMRDWRKEKEVDMDPRLFDLLWQVYRESGATQPIDIICGYRSPGTNAMLRARSGGVARHSQHILGKAIDFYIPGVPLAKIRAIGLEMQRGGVGFYPTSGSPFVHMDVGLVRHWPSIPREALAKIFPNGRTVHIPADGKPLRNYAAALADVERAGNAPNQRSLDAARAAGVITEGQVREAELIAEHPHGPRTLFAGLTGGAMGAQSADNADTMMAPGRQTQPLMRVASLTTPKPVAAARVTAKHAAAHVPLPTARPHTIAIAAKRKAPAQLMQTASLTSPAVTRNIWGDVITRGPGARAKPSPFDVAAADLTGGAGPEALAYAPESDPTPVARVRPMGSNLPRLPREATVLPSDGNSTLAVKPPMAIGGQRANSPWLRAAMLTPSVTDYMTTTRLGRVDPKWLHTLLLKPEQAVLMSFSADPHLGMVTDRFTGHAVVFIATATFVPPTALSLR